ncbi:hypothetical protein VM1G_04787 [Cytospora mali]|uniref:Rhodopsin domain-containing protein n=1 Tax=Cytospora mali TaxID=578113 RepID=A0A194W111_CYTMA|nr:hypothetical protein VM1G_04787 [Valsa mali]
MEPTASESQYLQEHIGDTKVPGIIIASVICGIMTCICVGLRFVARFLSGVGLGKDDYCIVMGLVLYLADIIILCISTKYGAGRHINVVTDARTLIILILCDENIYVFGILLIKFSILLLYHRIIPGKTFRNFLITTALLVTAWALAAFFTNTFTCYPVEAQWDRTIKGTCRNYGTISLGIGIANVIIDFILLGIPLPTLWKLQMSTRRKVLLFFALGAGSSACIASIVRLTYTQSGLSTYDESWDSVPVAILSGVEMCTAIIASCFATYRPLVERVLLRISSTSKRTTQENTDASDRGGWGKISVQRDIAIELGPNPMNSAPFTGPDIETAPLKDSNNFGPQSAIPLQHLYGSNPQLWQANVTIHGPRAP